MTRSSRWSASRSSGLLQHFPAGAPLLFPRQKRANLSGLRPIASRTYRGALCRWLEDCDNPRRARAAGAPDALISGAHTLGTILINRHVP